VKLERYLEMNDRIDYVSRQVAILGVGFAIGCYVMSRRMEELEEKVNELYTGRLQSTRQLSIGYQTGPRIPSGTEDSERGTSELSPVVNGK
jgi:hypothetical protein